MADKLIVKILAQKKSGIISGFFILLILIKKSLFLKNEIELQLMHFR